MWVWTGVLLVLLAVVGLVTFDLLAHYWAGRFTTWRDLRHHLLFLVGLRKLDRPLRTLRGGQRVTASEVRRPAVARDLPSDRRAVGADCYAPPVEPKP